MPTGNGLSVLSNTTNGNGISNSQQSDYADDEIFFQENPPQLKLVKVNDQVRRLQTIIRDRYVKNI